MSGHFIFCEKCGKKLLTRLPNGLWQFKFGKREGSSEPVVDMEIHGSLRMKCTRRTCKHVNVLHYFPQPSEDVEQTTIKKCKEDTLCHVQDR